jgi:hypothetical protein
MPPTVPLNLALRKKENQEAFRPLPDADARGDGAQPCHVPFFRLK